MTMLGPILPIQLLQQSKICPLSVFHIHCTCQASPTVTFMSLDRSKRQWEASLSGLTKRCNRRCMSGCALTQKNYFLEVSMHFQSAGMNTCMERNGDYIEKWSHCVPYVFIKLQDKKYLRFSFDSPSYIELCFLFFWIGCVFLLLKDFALNSSEHTIFPCTIFMPLGWGEVRYIKLFKPEEYKLLSIFPWISLWRSISGCVSGIFAPVSMVTFFASHYSVMQNTSWMGLIWTTISWLTAIRNFI